MCHICLFLSGHRALPPASFYCHWPQWATFWVLYPTAPPTPDLALFSKIFFCAIFPVTLHILAQTSQTCNICWISYLVWSHQRNGDDVLSVQWSLSGIIHHPNKILSCISIEDDTITLLTYLRIQAQVLSARSICDSRSCFSVYLCSCAPSAFLRVQ